MKRIKNLMFILLLLFTLNVQLTSAEEPWSKYPDNSEKNFQDVNSFYDSLDKKWYQEFNNAKLNIREKTYFKDINKVYSAAEEYVAPKSGGVGYHPKRQVYVFLTVSDDGKKMLSAVYDAETQRLISSTSEPEKRKTIQLLKF